MTLSISVTKKKRDLHAVKWYAGVSIFLFLFGIIYEKFSHEVYSWYMMGAFLISLAGGACPSILFGEKLYEKRTMYRCGLATLTVGSIMKGVLDIYGTTNQLLNLYWIVGGILLVAGAVRIVWKSRRN